MIKQIKDVKVSDAAYCIGAVGCINDPSIEFAIKNFSRLNSRYLDSASTQFGYGMPI